MLQDANFHVDTKISGILYVIFPYLQVSLKILNGFFLIYFYIELTAY